MLPQSCLDVVNEKEILSIRFILVISDAHSAENDTRDSDRSEGDTMKQAAQKKINADLEDMYELGLRHKNRGGFSGLGT